MVGGFGGVLLWLLPALAWAEMSFGEMMSPAAWREAVRHRFAVEEVVVGRLDLEIVASSSANGGPFRPSSLTVPLARLLDAEPFPGIELAEVAVRRTGDPGGWDGEVTLSRVRITDGPAPGERSIVLAGALDALPLDVQAQFAAAEPAPDGRLRRPFSINASLGGIDQTILGFLAADGEALEGRVQLDVRAIGDLLEAFGLRRQLEGSGQLRLAVAGPVDGPAADDISLVVELASGEQLRADGRIADLSRLTGIDLGFTANLVDETGTAPRASAALKLDLEALRGQISGSAEALTVEGLVFSTNLTAADIQEIGPISVERLVRDDQGRLALSGVRILAGEPVAPSLDLRGRIDDLLGRSGIAFEGRFDLDLVDLATGLPAPAGLGRLEGTLALSDTSGSLAIDHLAARQVGGGPLDLAVEKVAVPPGAPPSPIGIRLDIPDLDALAVVQGAAPIGGGSAGFEGTIELAPNFRLIGRGRVGSSSVRLDLSEDVVDDQLVLRGGVESPGLLLADLPRMAALARLWPEAEVADAGGVGDDLRARLDAELDTKATIVDAAGTAQGNFVAGLTVRDGIATLRPLRLDYLGGRADAELSFGMAGASPPLRLEARIQALNTGELLTELGIRPFLVGDLDANLELGALGSDRRALMASLEGEVELAMGEGRIGSRLVDLAAQDIVGWLFAGGTDTRLVCAVGRIAFAAGRGTVEGLILETENVQLLGAGAVDLGRETIDLAFAPRPVRGRLLPAVTSFRIHGPLAAPTVTLDSAGGVAGRAIVETLTLPFNVLGALLGGLTGGVPAACTLEP